MVVKMTDKLLPITLFIRKYLFHLIISLLFFVFLTVLSLFTCEKVTESRALIARYRAAELNETVFTVSKSYEEVFYSFNGSAYCFTENGRRISADVLMAEENGEFGKSPLGFNGGLSAGECAVSENLSFKFGLSLGDSLTFSVGSDGKCFDFKISALLPAQGGIDGKYMHDGVVILSESREMIREVRSVNLIAFTKDRETEYAGLITDDPSRKSPVVYSEELIKNAERSLLFCAVISLLCTAFVVAAAEMLVFGRIGKKYEDYLIMKVYGISRGRLLLTVLRDNAIKYIPPLLMTFLIFFARLRCYHTAFIYPALAFSAACAVGIAVLTLMTVMRKNKCLKIKT